VKSSDLNGAPAAAVDGFKEAAIIIGEATAMRIEDKPNRRKLFRHVVLEECDKWIAAIGEPEYGQPYTDDMREDFYGIMLSALGEVFAEVYGNE